MTPRRALAGLAVACAAVLALAAASAGPASAHSQRAQRRPADVPVIIYGAVGCTTGTAALTVATMVEVAPDVWEWRPGAPERTAVRSWYDGAWRPVPSVEAEGMLLVRSAYVYRTRAVAPDGRRTVQGPDFTMPEGCASWVDEIARRTA